MATEYVGAVRGLRNAMENESAAEYPGAVEKIFYLLFAATRGGPMRARVIEALKEAPQNANQLRESLGVDYRTVTHHLRILEKNNTIVGVGERYGRVYFLSNMMKEYYSSFARLAAKGSVEG